MRRSGSQVILGAMPESGAEPTLVVIDTTELWKSLELATASWLNISAGRVGVRWLLSVTRCG